MWLVSAPHEVFGQVGPRSCLDLGKIERQIPFTKLLINRTEKAGNTRAGNELWYWYQSGTGPCASQHDVGWSTRTLVLFCGTSGLRLGRSNPSPAYWVRLQVKRLQHIWQPTFLHASLTFDWVQALRRNHCQLCTGDWLGWFDMSCQIVDMTVRLFLLIIIKNFKLSFNTNMKCFISVFTSWLLYVVHWAMWCIARVKVYCKEYEAYYF